MMDPESGASLPVHAQTTGSSQGGVVQHVLQVLLEKLRTLLEAVAPHKHRDVGVENRFYFDQTEKVWKLHGGETEQERAEAEAFRFHTGRGLSSASAPATTACDASRGDWQSGALPPPPPSSGPVTASLHGRDESYTSSALAHPVYAPQGLGKPTSSPGISTGAQQSAPQSAPQSGPGASGASVPLSNPFGQALKSPFGTGPPLASPFAQANQDVNYGEGANYAPNFA